MDLHRFIHENPCPIPSSCQESSKCNTQHLSVKIAFHKTDSQDKRWIPISFSNQAGHHLLISLRMKVRNNLFQLTVPILLLGIGKNSSNLQEFSFSTGLRLLFDRDAG
jgi:hypothetical protein